MKSIPHPYVTSRKVTRGMKDYRGDKRENHSYFTHSFANDGGSGVGVVLHMADEEAHNSGMEKGEEEKNAEDLIKKMELFGDDAKGLYMLNSELASRVYAAPSLVL